MLKHAIDLGDLASHAIITDVGSTKASSVAKAADEIFGAYHHFIGGHPIAGAERSGFDARNGELLYSIRSFYAQALIAMQPILLKLPKSGRQSVLRLYK